MARPHCYIRKSHVQPGSRMLSAEVQEAEVRALAERHGETDLVVLSDIGRSGKNTKRPGYSELLQAIRTGRVSVIYAYSLSRLNRSTKDYAELAELCIEHGVNIRYVHDPDADFTSPTGRLIATILSGVAQMEREIDSERQRDNIRAKQARGERHGEVPYGGKPGEDLDVVVRAFLDGGSFHRAARLLNEQGIPARRGGVWHNASVRVILRTQRPDLIPAQTKRGAYTRGRYRLSGLLRCGHCGTTMTTQRERNGNARYRCPRAPNVGGHPKASIKESKLLGWVQKEAALLDAPAITIAGEDEERDGLLRDRERLGLAYAKGWLSAAETEARIAMIDTRLGGLQPAEVFQAPDIDWDTDAPDAVNAVLRSLWSEVILDKQQMPMKAVWRVPEWRRVA